MKRLTVVTFVTSLLTILAGVLLTSCASDEPTTKTAPATDQTHRMKGDIAH